MVAPRCSIVGRLSAGLLLAALSFSLVTAFGPARPRHGQGHGVQDFTCNKKAFYPTVPGGSGVRTLALPVSMCSRVNDTGMMLEALCCANTHVACSSGVDSPVLTSYDGSRYHIQGDAETVLAATYSRLCSMMMADKCQDCNKTDCSLFDAAPPAKSCYGVSHTDAPDGSGFNNKTNAEALPAAAPALLGAGTSCKTVLPVAQGFNTSEYLRASWYVQQQQVTGYQPKENLYCVVQTLNVEGAKVPFYSGVVTTVYNFATAGKVNGPPQNTANETKLCARQPNDRVPAAIINAPCFLPNLLAGDYWVVAIGPSPASYEWAIISAGQPTVQYKDGCTTKTTGTNGAGLWLFTRDAMPSKDVVPMMRQQLVTMGYTLDQLIDVPQQGCTYQGALIKK